MKFKLLSIGQKFEFEGETYVKTSPLIASNLKTSHNKMIPRYATLTLLDDSGTNTQQIKNDSVDAQEILNAFNLFYERCIEILEKNNAPMPTIKEELDNARDIFIKHIIQ